MDVVASTIAKRMYKDWEGKKQSLLSGSTLVANGLWNGGTTGSGAAQRNKVNDRRETFILIFTHLLNKESF
jgi:hypothetical protein